jgi:pantoate--beta-alanine ligase
MRRRSPTRKCVTAGANEARRIAIKGQQMSQIPIVRTLQDLRFAVQSWRRSGSRIALTPTMGALHEGHLSLVRLARGAADKVVASLFVNPAQFGPGEDYLTYPRDEDRDATLLREAGCDLLYAPGVAQIYPEGFATQVSVTGVTEPMEGAHRPGHFAGVATVVAKLLIQVGPDVAVFGEKDYQQLQTIRRLVADLDLPVDILPAPIVRDTDGLALSSRNAYLDARQRAIAPQLNMALRRAAEAIRSGSRIDQAEDAARRSLLDGGFDAVEYFEARTSETLNRLGPGLVGGPARLLAVARLGRTRLFDNVAI